MIYRLGIYEDLTGLSDMAEKAKAYFKESGIDQWQRGEPSAQSLRAAFKARQLYVLALEDGRPAAMITLAPGPEDNYEAVRDCWPDQKPYMAFHRVCVAPECKGRGIAAQLFAASESRCRQLGYESVRIDTHPDNRSMQRALEKSGYRPCGRLKLLSGAEKGGTRLGYHKSLA